MLPEANEVCVARREAHEPLLVLDHRVEEVADGEVPAVRRPEDLETPRRQVRGGAPGGAHRPRRSVELVDDQIIHAKGHQVY